MRRTPAFAALLALVVASCGPTLAPAESADLDRSVGYSLRVVTDPLTGCEYLAYEFKGITPRLNEYGQPRCRKAGR